jgi:hypothetical protein
MLGKLIKTHLSISANKNAIATVCALRKGVGLLFKQALTISFVLACLFFAEDPQLSFGRINQLT